MIITSFSFCDCALLSLVHCSIRYKFLSIVGKGGFGTVHKVQDRHTKEFLACKTVPKNDTNEKALIIEMLQREVLSLRLVKGQSDHLLEFRDVYEDISSVHILTSLYTGGELYERLAIAKQKWTERQAAELIRNILEGISAGCVVLFVTNFRTLENKTYQVTFVVPYHPVAW